MRFPLSGKSLYQLSTLNPACPAPNCKAGRSRQGRSQLLNSSVLLVLLGCVALAACAKNSQSAPVSPPTAGASRFQLVGTCAVGAEAHSVAVNGDTAYVSLGLKGLAIVDVANPRAPQLVKQMTSGIAPVFIALDGNRAYAADRYEGIQILDRTKKRDPVVVGTFVLPPFVTHLAVTPQPARAGGLVYAACGGEGLHILRKDADGGLTRIGLFREVKFTRFVLLNKNIAFLADAYEDAFKILDVSVPERIELLSATNIAGYCDAVAQRGDYAFLASRSDGFVVMDVSDARHPKLVTRVKKPGVWVKHLAISGDVLVVANDRAGIELYDVSPARAGGDCATPRLLDSYDTVGRAVWVEIVPDRAGGGDLVYVADWEGGLLILRIADRRSRITDSH